jgi:HemY protein
LPRAARIGCKTARGATSNCAAPSIFRAAAPRRDRPKKARGCSPPNGRSTIATRRGRSSCSARVRLRLQATRLGRQPQEALKTARLLAKHQGFSKIAAQGLLRSLAFESLDTVHDVDQLKRVWQQFDNVDRRDAFVAARAADRAAAFGAFDDARAWLRPFWDRPTELSIDERAAVSLGLVSAVPGIGADWLPRLEAAAGAFTREAAVALAVGCALAERQLWGKARLLLEQAAEDASLGEAPRRKAWLLLALLARQEGDAARAAGCFEAAARLG